MLPHPWVQAANTQRWIEQRKERMSQDKNNQCQSNTEAMEDTINVHLNSALLWRDRKFKGCLLGAYISDKYSDYDGKI